MLNPATLPDPVAEGSASSTTDSAAGLTREPVHSPAVLPVQDCPLQNRCSRLAAHEQMQFQSFVSSVAEYAIYTLDPLGRVTTWNYGAEQITGYTREEILGKCSSVFFVPEDIAAGFPAKELAAAQQVGRAETYMWRARKDGKRFWARVTISALRDKEGQLRGYVKVMRDLTTQRQNEEALRTREIELENAAADLEARVRERTIELAEALSQKEVLLREVYHRVKNNLQVIQSLLKMEARSLPDDETRRVLGVMAQRVHAMALAHERLYRKKDLVGLSLVEYLRDLFNGAVASQSLNPAQVRLVLDADEIPMSLQHAIPFGLLVNELICNSLKHGFRTSNQGTVDVSVRRVDGVVHLTVQDDGVGLPDGFDAAPSSSMGLQLASSLAHQLGGSLSFASQNGCRVESRLTRL